MAKKTIDCAEHGERTCAFVCQHLSTGDGLGFHWGEDPDDPLQKCPDAWCDRCEKARKEEGGWNDRSEAIANIKLICDECYVALRSRNWREDAAHVASIGEACVHELQHKQDELRERYRIDEWERWDWNRDDHQLIFSHEGSPKVVANIVFVDSYSSKSTSWMWAWANPAFTDDERRLLLPVKEFGAELGSMKVASGYWMADESDGWEMTAFAARVLGAADAYRTPTESGHTYMIIMDARWAI